MDADHSHGGSAVNKAVRPGPPPCARRTIVKRVSLPRPTGEASPSGRLSAPVSRREAPTVRSSKGTGRLSQDFAPVDCARS